MSPRIGLDTNTIMQTAIAIANDKGLSQVTLASIAQRLNIRPPSLYNHVAGLQDIRNKLALHGIRELTVLLRQAMEGVRGDEAVRAFGIAYVAYARAHPGLYEATQLVPDADDPELIKAAAEIVGLAVGCLGHFNLEEEVAIHHVRGLRSMLHGFASLVGGGGFGMPLDLDVSLRLMIDTFLAGMHVKYAGEQVQASSETST